MLQNYFRDLTLLIFLTAATILLSHCKSDEPKTYPQLYINEVMPDNETVLEDGSGEHDDWLEIYNPNDEPVNLAGWYISEKSGNLRQYQFPATDASITTIPAKGRIIIWPDEQPGQGILHLNFRLSNTGETIYLSGDGANLIDFITFGAGSNVASPETDQSVGRIEDGAAQWVIFTNPTPGSTNLFNPEPDPEIFINEFMAANDSFIADEFGEYNDWIEIYNYGTEAVNIGGWYITDDSTNIRNWQIPDSLPAKTTIEPGGFLLLWADEDTEQGVLHIGIKLSADGEEIGLSADGVDFLDFIRFGPGAKVEAPATDHSSGRIPDGSGSWQTFQPGSDQPPTPQNPNGR